MHRITRLFVLSTFIAFRGCVTLGQDQPPVDPASTHKIPPFRIPAIEPGVAYERFIVIGDTGTGLPGQHKLAGAMALRAKADGLDFWLTTGDNIYPNGVKSADDPQWKTKFADVYADSSLRVPIYATLGNHDYRSNPQAQIEYGKRNKNWNMPAFHYTFTRTMSDGTKVQFFAIDTTPIVEEHADAKVQVAWLDKELAKSDARWKIVFGHHPLYGHNPWRGHNEILIAKLEPLFVKHKVDVYFAGHDHALEMLKPVKGVNHVISGAGAGPEWAYPVKWTEESFYVATLGGFTFCRISKDELVIEFVRSNGKTQYAHTLTK